MEPWQFKEYVSEDGSKPVSEWFSSEHNARNKLLWLIRELRYDEPTLPVTHFRPLREGGQGLVEIIMKVDRKQYRPLAFYGPERRVLTLLVGATKTSNKGRVRWNPKKAIEIACERKAAVKANPGERTAPYES